MLSLVGRISVLALLLSGCSSAPEKPQSLIDSLSATAIVTAATTPDVDLDTFAKGRWAGAGKGFLTGTGLLMASPLVGAAMGSPATPVGVAIGAGLGAAVGAALLPYYVTKGAMRAIPGDVASRIKHTLKQAVLDGKPQENLARQLLETAGEMPGRRIALATKVPASDNKSRHYRPEDFPGFDSVLEVAIDKIAYTDGEGANPEIAFFMSASARLIQLSSSKIIYQQNHEFRSRNRSWSDWLKNDGLEITIVFEDAYQFLAKQIAEDFFPNSAIAAPH